MLCEDALDDGGVRVGVAVDQHIAKADSRAEELSGFEINPAGVSQRRKQGGVCLGFTQSLIGNDMRGDVQHRLDTNLERVLHEPALLDVGRNPLGLTQRAELAQARFDERELLAKQVQIGHLPAPIR